MNDLVISLIRSWVPAAIGSGIAFLAARGVEIDSATTEAAVIAVTGLAIGVYITIARALESKWPALGFLLGKKAQPSYEHRGGTDEEFEIPVYDEDEEFDIGPGDLPFEYEESGKHKA